MGAHFLGFDHLYVGADPGDLSRDGPHVVSAELDLHPAVDAGGADAHACAEHPAQELHRFRRGESTHAKRRASLIHFVGDQTPCLVEIEAVGAYDGFAGDLDRSDAVDAKRSQPSEASRRIDSVQRTGLVT